MNIGVTASSESKALRLARYLKEFVGLRSTTVYDLNKYESVLWFSDMPQQRECRSPAWNNEFEAGDPWLVVHKQQFPKPPAPPEIILPWINHQALKRAAAEIPKLRPTMMEPDPEVEIGEGEERPYFFPSGTKEQYEASIAAVHPSRSTLPKGQIFHAAGPTTGGWQIVAIHDSKESWERFRDSTLLPQMQKGIPGGFTGPPQENGFEVHNLQK